MSEKDINDVIAELEEKCKEQPKSVIAHHHLALVYRKAGRLDDAIRELKTAIDIDEQSTESYINLGGILFEQGKTDEALEVNKKALIYAKLPAHKANAHTNIGLIHQQRGEVDAAIDAYTKACAHEPKSAFAWVNLSTAQVMKGDFDAAETAARKAIEQEPDFGMAHNNLAVALHYAGRSEEARAALDKAMQLGYKPDPRFVEALAAG